MNNYNYSSFSPHLNLILVKFQRNADMQRFNQKMRTKSSTVFTCLRRENVEGSALNMLKSSTITKYAPQKLKERLNRFLSVMKDARERGPRHAQTALLQGPAMVSSHLVHTCKGPDEDQGETDATPVVMFNRLLQGVKYLIRDREDNVLRWLSLYQLCACGVCVTENDLKLHYSILLLAAQMTLSEPVPNIFFVYVKERERDVYKREENAALAEGKQVGKGEALTIFSTKKKLL